MSTSTKAQSTVKPGGFFEKFFGKDMAESIAEPKKVTADQEFQYLADLLVKQMDALTIGAIGCLFGQKSEVDPDKEFTKEYDFIAGFQDMMNTAVEQIPAETLPMNPAFVKNLLECKDPQPICDFIEGMLLMGKGIMSNQEMGETIASNALDLYTHIPSAKKLGEAMMYKEHLRPYAKFIESLVTFIEEISDMGAKHHCYEAVFNAARRFINECRNDKNGFMEAVAAFRNTKLLTKFLGKVSIPDKENVNEKTETKKKEKKSAEDKVSEKSSVTEPENQAACAQSIPANTHVPDEDAKPTFTSPENVLPMQKPQKPDFIVENAVIANPANIASKTNEVEPIPFDENALDENAKAFFTKFPWALEIVKIGAKNGYCVSASPVCGPDGEPKLISFYSTTADGIAVADRCFIVDLGVAISRETVLWNCAINTNNGVRFDNIENAKFTLRIFDTIKKKKNNRDVTVKVLNDAMVSRVFRIGLSSFTTEEIKKNQPYGPSKMEANRVINWISMPRLSSKEDDSKNKNNIITDLGIRVARVLAKEYPNTRYTVKDFNSDTLAFILSSENEPANFMGPIQPAPYRKVFVVPTRDENGFVYGDDGHVKCDISVCSITA